jgi:hypothetical protein
MRKVWVLMMLVALSGARTAEAQQADKRPKSPPGSSATQIGGAPFDPVLGYVNGKWVEISYGRPIRRGRDIFGPDDFVEVLNDGAPVWRAGANVSTRLKTEAALEIGGKRLAPGEYTVFIELARDAWTLIVSTYRARLDGSGTGPKDPNAIYGAYDYTPAKDLLRTPMTLEKLPHAFDQLHWEFVDITPVGGRLAIIWEKMMASVPFTVVK